MKEFVRAASEDDTPLGNDPLLFKVGDDEFTAYPPTTAMFALFMASQSDTREVQDKVAGLVDFLDQLIDEEQRITFHRALLDRDHPLSFTMLQDIVEWLVEEWSARPTQESSDSSPQQRTGGRTSTGKRRSTAKSSSVSA